MRKNRTFAVFNLEAAEIIRVQRDRCGPFAVRWPASEAKKPDSRELPAVACLLAVVPDLHTSTSGSGLRTIQRVNSGFINGWRHS